MSFKCERLEIEDVLLIRGDVFRDCRGYFLVSHQTSVFEALGLSDEFVQDNISFSRRGVLRGLHYQRSPSEQGKLVMPLLGEVFDVAVDVRRDSGTFGRWLGHRLVAGSGEMLYIPPGFAHGFCVVTDEALLAYKVTNEYAPACEGGICWNDPGIGIEWPVAAPILSEKDAALPPLASLDAAELM